MKTNATKHTLSFAMFLVLPAVILTAGCRNKEEMQPEQVIQETDKPPAPPSEPAPATQEKAAQEGAKAVQEGAGAKQEAPQEPPADKYQTSMQQVGDLTVVSAQLCESIEERKCVNEGRVFQSGTMAWILLKIKNASKAERKIFISYVEQGKTPSKGRGIGLTIPGQPIYATFAKSTKHDPGLYQVVVRDEQNEELASLGLEFK